MLGRSIGSTCTQSKPKRISLSATSSGNESLSLLSIQVLTLPPSTAAVADSITELFTKTRSLLSNLYFNGSSPDKSSNITTPNAYTSVSCVATPEI
ncbi:hypothetical protein F8388_013250 [Cannabis sativa]|uniref:Uncharacterized protein n=1 Tax=Cannabis sativa TaxID=3483 RepID=A0A7J6ED78_CANSA|nr:hypothetical protein F8388_013250 [Cannabis sativa]KAF4369163.1 hypothetical protein G4B88_020941 [Cannabis sativa]KAF4391743.1 hypothetical protein G4B88_005629 [Cannabis sativa]